MGEFDLIKQFFTRPTPRAVLGVGDDCALLQPRPGMHLAISTDMLVSGRHFFADVDPHALGHKALAVNLSDLAACGATPLAFTLALSLPQADPAWLAPFSQGLLALADAHGCELVGGDTTKGPLNICITVFGEVPQGLALLRSGARDGDDIYVSGTLGDASLALAQMLQERGAAQATDGTATTTGWLATLPPEVFAQARLRLERPTPRLALGQALRGIATAAADISDGLLGDLGHILERSDVGATLDTAAALPLMAAYPALVRAADATTMHSLQRTLLKHVLSGGDDYELVFTAPAAMAAAVQAAADSSQTVVTRIGRIESQRGLRLLDERGRLMDLQLQSFDHFGGAD
jgi:thiamine-monophosphate kinase